MLYRPHRQEMLTYCLDGKADQDEPTTKPQAENFKHPLDCLVVWLVGCFVLFRFHHIAL